MLMSPHEQERLPIHVDGSSGRGDLPGRHEAGHGARADHVIPGEIIPGEGPVVLDPGRPAITLVVANTGDRPVQVGSHYHFAQANPALARALVPEADVPGRGKADLINNDALPDIRVEPDTFTVRIDGEVIEEAPAAELPMAQRYFLF